MLFEHIFLPFFRSAAKRAMNFDDGPVALPVPPPDGRAFLYIHVPFCVSLCPFCSFHRVVYRQSKAARYFTALRREILTYRDAGFRFTGVYVGGGTPTVAPGELEQTLALVRECFPVREISVETNPSDLTEPVLDMLVKAGVNRLSVGVQSFDDGLLREMERYDKYGSGGRILEHLEHARGRFTTLNVDMIFNLPHQTPEILERDLNTVLASAANQVSFYPLMTSDSVRRKMTARMGRLDRHRVRGYYQRILERLRGEFRPSSAWCFSRGASAGIDEYIADNGDYVGVGSGAFSYVNGVMYATTFSLNVYHELISSGRPAITRSRHLATRERHRYEMLLKLFGLRMDHDWMRQRFDPRFEANLALELAALRVAGALHKDARGYALTERGMYLWVLQMSAFFESVNVFREQMRGNISSELDHDEDAEETTVALERITGSASRADRD
ncbi:MAG TPA: coproporphyrinogen III oxidase family protein [Xanthomonadales bacterium]|nr:coproporphyrinogen III oxidase family protein [Xanthomonadales bacterium]